MPRFDFLLLFSTLLIFCECEWVQITQKQEKSSPKSQTGKPQYYNFPKNEYVYITTPNSVSYEKEEDSPSPSLTSTKVVFSSNLEDFISVTATSTTAAFDQNVPLATLEDRIDTVDILDSAPKLVLTTEDFRAAMDGKVNDWPTDIPGSARITRVNNDEVKKEKLKNERTEGFVPFLKRIQDELITNGRKNLRWKIGMLRKLRDDMLLNIDERINQLWGRKSSEARDHKEDDYDMHFPSNEGALMTIGFLTFAVFLIKLVLVELAV